MKFYLPLIEILLSFLLLYFVPEGVFRLLKRRFDIKKSPITKFMVENLRGFLFGTAVALSFLFAFGVSYEDFTANSVRSAADGFRRMLGVDALSICVGRAKEEFRYTPEGFAEAASSFDRLGPTTYTERQLLLARGNMLLLVGDPSTPEELYERALAEYCTHHRIAGRR
ncbi:hypothetical protein [Pseudoxanthomonas putridarboris]|uniref:Uncharacterized protein n=1 Tax=Pseudoxanthomonas putridarboris TaxID=752605 RepID=A0ABU9J532_9GAMM